MLLCRLPQANNKQSNCPWREGAAWRGRERGVCSLNLAAGSAEGGRVLAWRTFPVLGHGHGAWLGIQPEQPEQLGTGRTEQVNK